MGQSVSQNKKHDGATHKINLVQAILRGIEELNYPNQLQQGLTLSQELLEEEYQQKRRPSLQVRDVKRGRKKSWFYYDEQQKQQKKVHDPMDQKKQMLEQLDSCKFYDKNQMKSLFTQILTKANQAWLESEPPLMKKVDSINITDSSRKQDIYNTDQKKRENFFSSNLEQKQKFNQDFFQNSDIRKRENTANTLDIQFSPKLDLLKIPQDIKQKKKLPPKRFDTNLLEFFRNGKNNPKNGLKRLSSSSDYQDLLSIMGTQKQTNNKQSSIDLKQQDIVFQKKIQTDLLQFLKIESNQQRPSQSQLDSSIMFSNRSNHNIETTLSLVTSLTQKLLFLNFDQINQSDHIQEEFLQDGGCLESPSSTLSKDECNKTIKTIQQQLNQVERSSQGLLTQQTDHLITFTLSNSPQPTINRNRSRLNRSLTNPTAIFQAQQDESYESGDSNMNYQQSQFNP